MNWSANPQSEYVFLQSQLSSPQPFTEISDQAEDGTMYYAMQIVSLCIFPERVHRN